MYKLEDLYAMDSFMQAVTLQGQLYNLQFPTGGSMQAFLMKTKGIHDQLLAMSAALSYAQLASLILTKLPSDYDMVARALRCQVTKNQLDFDDLSSLLLEEESVLVAQGKVRVSSTGMEHGLASSQKKKRLGPVAASPRPRTLLHRRAKP